MTHLTTLSSIYKFGLSVCLFVCLFVSNKRQNGWADRAQIFCGTSRDSREGLWIIKISNICLHQNSIVIKFFKILKIRELFLFCFTMIHKENMFTINLEDGREAPSKARKKGAKRLEFLVIINSVKFSLKIIFNFSYFPYYSKLS